MLSSTGGGMKTLLLDPSCTSALSQTLSQTTANDSELYLISQLGKKVPAVGGMKAIIFCRPTPKNIDLIKREISPSNNKQHNTYNDANGYPSSSQTPLSSDDVPKPNEGLLPTFQEYHIFFSNVLKSADLQQLAAADSNSLIRQVQEFPMDYVPINESLFTLNLPNSIPASQAWGTARERSYAPVMEREVEGVLSFLLSQRRALSKVIYPSHSPYAKHLSEQVVQRSQADDFFHFRSRPTTLLVLDRLDDPVTPLLSQWTYQAMCHELLGLNDARLLLKGAPNVSKDLEEVVLNPETDTFYRDNRFSNFGELGENIRTLLESYQAEQKRNANITTIADMQTFMERYPAFRAQSHSVSKHVAVMTELARLVDQCALMDVSAFEQDLACADSHSEHLRGLVERLSGAGVKAPDKLRLGLLYALRYEATGNVPMVKGHMSQGGVTPDKVSLVDSLLRYAGSASRGKGLYGKRDFFGKIQSAVQGIQGVQNVYSQHVPLARELVDQAFKNKLPAHYASAMDRGQGQQQQQQHGSSPSSDCRDLIVYIVGGCTYEEAKAVEDFNAQGKAKGVRVVLGGPTVHNSTAFLDEVKGLLEG
eukprot:CAMPEP_0182463604 /NCGR_PEP_ID=MMETSP1319-20130603/7751_1 /TAXON_ID=172717 /ORGANISM="Bolidomonas pacifica, Strain RCC208" /LENGTH=591 /DNA_ID=CAMNT_0024663171 /DNA_START=336 /DNA_END=2106 /DNA_ORIENTATION=-